jgi:hypothetical protein
MNLRRHGLYLTNMPFGLKIRNMKQEEIKSKLEYLGYKMFIKNTHLWGGIKGGEGPIADSYVINGGFNIFFETGKASVIMANSIVGQEGEFDNEEDLIEFIKKNSPLKSNVVADFEAAICNCFAYCGGMRYRGNFKIYKMRKLERIDQQQWRGSTRGKNDYFGKECFTTICSAKKYKRDHAGNFAICIYR